MAKKLPTVQGEVDIKVADAISALTKFQASLQKTDDKLGANESKLKKHKESFDKFASGLKGLGAAFAGSAILNGGIEMLKMVQDVELANAKFSRQLDLTEEQAKRMKKVISDIFNSGVSENKQEIQIAAKILFQKDEGKLFDTNQAEFTRVSSLLTSNAQTMEQDVAEYSDAVMKYKGNIKGAETYEKAIAGVNEVLSQVRTIQMDQISEYSIQANKAGFTSKEFIDIGKIADKSEGSFKADTAYDAVKEVFVKNIDNMDTDLVNTIKAFNDYGKVDKNKQAEIDKKIVGIINDFKSIKDDEVRGRKITDYIMMTFYREKQLNPAKFNEDKVALGGTLGGEDSSKFFNAFVDAYGSGQLGKNVKVNENYAQQNEDAMKNANQMTAQVRMAKQAFYDEVVKPMFDGFFEEKIDEKGNKSYQLSKTAKDATDGVIAFTKALAGLMKLFIDGSAALGEGVAKNQYEMNPNNVKTKTDAGKLVYDWAFLPFTPTGLIGTLFKKKIFGDDSKKVEEKSKVEVNNTFNGQNMTKREFEAHNANVMRQTLGINSQVIPIKNNK